MKPLALCLAMLLSLSGALSGCSWLFVQPLPPQYRPGDRPDCTTGQTLPAIDAAFALSNAGLAVFEAEQRGLKSIGAPFFVVFVAGSLWLSSAIYGYNKTAACVKAKQDDDPAPGLGALPPVPPTTPAARQNDPY